MARSTDHQDAVSRRLALLSAELAGERPEPPERPERPGRPEPPAVPEVPLPGRHASRRASSLPGTLLPERLLPETLHGRVALGPAQLAVVAVLVAIGLAVTCWWVLRGQPSRVEAPAPVALTSQPPLVDASPVAARASATAASVTVDVTGKVRHPGIVVLDAGARVVDALEEAGGARPGVDLSGLNLARVLVDGEQVVVGVPPPAGVAASAAASPGASGGPLVNLNTASQAELEALPEVGPVTAQAILAFRDEHGGFTAVDELLEVDGIGDATLGQLAPYVTV
ncbi:ComEA family DNA-binding protein [Nocardioides sp. URHA0032]|uniref:ComEA family DNA-binding protein n=1 Tax=Nocardioides sp. URHA0032 TaxID=1380388 RepID=UPI0006851FCA|nr:ComEA family DNA-binding protein [Nocardioides sp. URHA0032]